MKPLAIDLIRCDGGTQMRAELSVDVYMDYRDKILAGVEFPPLDVFFDGSEYWLADGFHRFYGHREAKKASIKCNVHNGTVRDAILFAVGANATHGLTRTKADKRNAINALLSDKEWCKWSNGVVAEKCHVTPQYVGDIRRELETVSSSPAAKTKNEPKVGKDGKARKPPKKKPASVTGGSEDRSAAPPSLPSVGTVNRTDEGSQGDGDAGECPHGGPHDFLEGACIKCHEPDDAADEEPATVAGKVSGGITFDPKELTPQSVKDGFGDEVTGELRAAFAIRAEFQEKRQQLTNLKTWITQRVSHPGCAVLKSGESRIKTDIDNLDTELKFATPHCECVYCKNKMPKVANCNACKGRGWITQEIYKQAPKELKRA